MAAWALAAVLSACGGSDEQSGTPIAPPNTQVQPGSLAGRVQSASDGQPIAGATVSVDGVATTTGDDGSFAFSELTQVNRIPVAITAPGYTPTVRIASVTGGRVTTVPVQLVPVAATAGLDAAVGGTVTVPGSTAQITFPAGAIVTAAGAAPTQPVQVQLTPIDTAQDPSLATGDYRTLNDTSAAWLESFGALAVTLTDASGGSYQLAAGQSATVRIPASTRAGTLPTTTPLYGFNESTGLWEREGTATLTGTAPNQYYEGTITRITTWAAEDITSTVQVSGCVRDAAGRGVARAYVEIDGITYSGLSNVLTDSSGNFSVPMRRNASAVVSARAGTQLSNARAVTVTTSNLSLGSNCLVMTEGAISIRLTWGAAPLDVDSHLLTPQGAHISYSSKGSLTATPYANLDIDDITSFGPEIITIRRVAQGTYRYYLHNYSGTFGPGMTESPVRVEVRHNGTTSVFTPGPGEGTLRNWHAFDIVVNGACGVAVTPVDAWLASAPSNPNQNGAAVTYCN